MSQVLPQDIESMEPEENLGTQARVGGMGSGLMVVIVPSKQRPALSEEKLGA